MIKFFDPLAQFDVLNFQPSCIFNIFSLIFGVTDFIVTIELIFISLIIWIIRTFYQRKKCFIFLFSFDTIISALLNKKNYNYRDLFLVAFSIIFIYNISGLIPYVQTVSSQLIVTLFLSSVIIIV